jgi:hypothetical protein
MDKYPALAKWQLMSEAAPVAIPMEAMQFHWDFSHE